MKTGPSYASIHPSAWKERSKKYGCSILYSLNPTGQVNGLFPGPMNTHESYILWRWIKMRQGGKTATFIIASPSEMLWKSRSERTAHRYRTLTTLRAPERFRLTQTYSHPRISANRIVKFADAIDLMFPTVLVLLSSRGDMCDGYQTSSPSRVEQRRVSPHRFAQLILCEDLSTVFPHSTLFIRRKGLARASPN